MVGRCLSLVIVSCWLLFVAGRRLALVVVKENIFSAANFLIHDECVVLRVCAKLVDTYHCDMSFARC